MSEIIYRLGDGDEVVFPADTSSAKLAAFVSALLAELDRVEQRIDGDLLGAVIAEACPLVLSRSAATATAERALAKLAGVHGVTVIRGADSKPWTPDLEAGVAPSPRQSR